LASEAFIAGLLHNLGIAVQLNLDTPGIQAMIQLRRDSDRRDIRELELEHAAVGHEDCGSVIFEAWQLPEPLIASARHHHAPLLAPEPHRALAALVNLGANLGLASGNTYTLEPTPIDRNTQIMASLGLSTENLDEVAVHLPERVAQLTAALQDG
jgi:HD-like signal output (HDOD) protein